MRKIPFHVPHPFGTPIWCSRCQRSNIYKIAKEHLNEPKPHSPALGTLMAAVSLAAIPDPVKTDSGSVAGTSNTDASVRMFKGIPFAAPPVGDLRWKVAQPPAKWDGVKMATEFSPTCANGAGGGRGGRGRGGAPGGAARGGAPAGPGAQRGLPVPQRMDAREIGRRQAAGDDLDLWRRVHRRFRFGYLV